MPEEEETREVRTPWMLYPEDKIKRSWDIIMGLLLIATCLHIPYKLAFNDSSRDEEV